MTHPAPQIAESVEGQATTWFARQRSGEMTPEEAAALQEWLDADLRHRLAFEAVEALWGGFGETRDAPEVLAMRAEARRRPAPAWRRLAAGLAAAAVLGAGVWGGSQLNLFHSHELPNQTFRTEVGQRSTVTLPDGSVVTLNTGTLLRTRADGERRLLYLDRGQAYFKVARDRAHPFVVHAGGRTVTALGTAFDVRAENGRFEVTLVEGKVRVEAPLASGTGLVAARAVQKTEMVAGSQLVAGEGGRLSVEPTDTQREIAWTTGWLKFENERLGDVVGELARYSDTKILLEDPALAALPVSGRFKADDLDAFLNAVRIYDIEPVAAPRDGVVRLAMAEAEKN